ncbi:MAG: nicotinamide riboside transporter PnuC [Gemmatimonadaceae bacterium]|nr:nicotinamide riboside transporter PnuC [Gemmatimonadaceae bacterium]
MIDWLRTLDPLESAAVIAGIISVYLSVREHVWSWPTAIVNVGLYAVVFWRVRLYADAGLQVVYLLISVWGWYNWLFGGAGHSPLHVSRITRAERWVLPPLVIASAALLGFLLVSHTDASLPWLDAILTTTSLAAQYLMTRKRVENWWVWIAVDVVYVPMYVTKGLPSTALLYVVFLALAIQGARQWGASWRAAQAAA